MLDGRLFTGLKGDAPTEPGLKPMLDGRLFTGLKGDAPTETETWEFGRGREIAALNDGHPDEGPAVGTQATAQPPSQQAQQPVVVTGTFDKYQGLKVASVRLESAVKMTEERLQQLVPQRAGEPLDRGKIRQGIDGLFRTGLFADVEVRAERTPAGEVELIFAAKENYFVGVVSVDKAPNPPSNDQMVNATKLQLGELFTDEKLASAITRLKRVLRDHGYHRATVSAEHFADTATQQVNIAFHVVPGPAARVGEIAIDGDSGFSVAEVEEIAHLRPGDRVTLNSTNRALEKIRKRYQSQRRLEAQVAIAQTVYHDDTNRLDYRFRLERGPTIDISVQGASISRRRLKKLVPTFEENAVDEDLLNEGLRNVRDFFQQKGYFDAKVDWKSDFDPAKNQRTVVYMIDTGKKHSLVSIAVQGNHYFDAALLRERMLLQTTSWLLENGRFSEVMVTHDKQSIENLYRTNGFNKVTVQTETVDDCKGHTGDLCIVFRIAEGTQVRVNKTTIAGNKSFDTTELEGMLSSTAGEPFSEANLATDRDVLLSYYFNAGFPAVRVEASAKPDGENKEDVAYTITEGERVFVDRVLLSGLRYTKGFVAAREFELWDRDPLSQAHMLGTQRKLYDLGLFSAVDLAVQNPEGDADHKNLLANFEEARRWTFNYGFGFEVETGSPSQACPNSLVPELRNQCKAQFAKVFGSGQPTASPRVSLGVTRINFRGRDQTIVFKGNLGRLEQTAQISFEQPRWFNHPNMTMTLSMLYDHSRNVQTFTSERVEAAGAVQQSLTNLTTLVYRFAYRRVKAIDNTLIVDVEQIPILSAPVRVGIPSITYIRDKRDNPIETHKGNFTTADFGTATSWLGSEANFNRLFLQNSTYHQFGRNKWVFARSTRIGVAAPFGGPVQDQNGAAVPPFIPLPERFFAGGANSLRGFDLNGAGPRDLSFGTPLGGGGMFVNSLELRTPPVSLPFVGQNMGFVLFHDAGNVFNNPGDIWSSLAKVRQPNFSDCRSVGFVDKNTGQWVGTPQDQNHCSFNYLSHAIGSGIRYKTPIGPVRVDVGYNLNPTTFPRYCINGCEADPHFTVPVPHVMGDIHTLSRWNFFFSIGQTF